MTSYTLLLSTRCWAYEVKNFVHFKLFLAAANYCKGQPRSQKQLQKAALSGIPTQANSSPLRQSISVNYETMS